MSPESTLDFRKNRRLDDVLPVREKFDLRANPVKFRNLWIGQLSVNFRERLANRACHVDRQDTTNFSRSRPRPSAPCSIRRRAPRRERLAAWWQYITNDGCDGHHSNLGGFA
jgi:hypothetical protein